MSGNAAWIAGGENAGQCEAGRRLWQRLLKLRWLRLEGEAEEVASEIAALDCAEPLRLPQRIFPTD